MKLASNSQINDTIVRQLQETIDTLCLSAKSSGRPAGIGADDRLSPQASRLLAAYDHAHRPRLHAEAKTLADGGSLTSNGTAFPAIFGRAVVREALVNTALLQACQVVTDNRESSTLLVPHRTRDAGTLLRRGITYEGQEIPRIGLRQGFDSASVIPVKFSLQVSNEVLHFSSGGRDAEALAAFINLAAEQFREIMVMRIADELARISDSYLASEVTGEDIAGQLDGSTSLIKTAAFPLVRPWQQRTLAGEAIGSEEAPIALIVNDSAVAEWDGSGDQSAGIYYEIENPTLGFIRLVDESGNPAEPAATGTCTLSYSAATNRILFDRKLPAATTNAAHLDGAITALTTAKTAIFNRSRQPAGFCAMPGTLADTLTDAGYFAGSEARTAGLTQVKALAVHPVDVPGSDFNAERVVVGVDDTIVYGVAKPLEFVPPFNRFGSPDRLTYGVELSAVHVPLPARNRFTSIVMYDSDTRAAAV